MNKLRMLLSIKPLNSIGTVVHSPMKKIFTAIVSNKINWDKVSIITSSDDKIRAMKNELYI